MTGSPFISSGTQFTQAMVDQRPRFDNGVRRRKRKHSGNQVMGQNLIRPDKRHKVRYL